MATSKHLAGAYYFLLSWRSWGISAVGDYVSATGQWHTQWCIARRCPSLIVALEWPSAGPFPTAEAQVHADWLEDQGLALGDGVYQVASSVLHYHFGKIGDIERWG